MNLKSFLKLAIDAAEAACKEILEVYHSDDFEARLKSDNSPLTLADQRAHSIIVKHLEPTGLPILSEEGKSISYEVRKNWKQFWMVDPLDGTKEFIKRNDEFTVNIALIENQEPVIGVVAVPVPGIVYYGAKDLGVFKKSTDSKFEIQNLKFDRSEILNLKSEIRVVASRSHMNEETRAFIEKLGPVEMISAGSSLKFMLLAEGKADIYPRFAPTMEWDTAAAHGILRELGFNTHKTDSNEELIYNKEDLLNPYFIAER